MKSPVTLTVAMLLVLPAMSCAQDRRSAADRNSVEAQQRNIDQHSEDRAGGQDHKPPDAGKSSPRRLESVTWNSVKHELTWVISKGEKKEGASYKALGSENYLINMDDATMSFSGEIRRFSKEEAANVHILMDLISKYAVDSTVWWDDGQGEPVNGDGKGKEPEKRRTPDRGPDNIAILHVTARPVAPPCALTPSELQLEIRNTERKLRELKQLQTMLDGTMRLSRYTTETY